MNSIKGYSVKSTTRLKREPAYHRTYHNAYKTALALDRVETRQDAREGQADDIVALEVHSQPSDYGNLEILLEEGECRWLYEAVGTLEAREAEIVIRHFGLFGVEPLTRGEIGKRLGVTASRVQQIENRALRNLRHPRHRTGEGGFVDVNKHNFNRYGW